MMRTLVEPITDLNSFLSEWRRIYARSGARFFLSPAWIGTMLASADLRRFRSVRVDDDFHGAHALALIAVPGAGLYSPWREARFNESGIAALDRIYVEYNDVLAAENASRDVRKAAVTAIIGALPAADQIVFRNVRPLMSAAIDEACAENDLDFDVLSVQPTFEIRLEGATQDDVPGNVSLSLRRKIRRSIRRYEERGQLVLSRAQSAEDRIVAWTELMGLSTQKRSRRGVRSVFQQPKFRAFHEALLAGCPEHVDLVRLTCDGETLAVLYNFVDRLRVYNYQSGVFYEADNQLAPGFVAHSLAAKRYREDGYHVYDLLAGDAEYKRRLGVEGEILSTIAVTRRNLRARARAAIKSFVRSQGA
jgi:CelD/BcsL family acetyltransferase involved in cellulose biosynthesis